MKQARYLTDHRGVSIIALIIIMGVLGSLGYVFSSLIATKQYSMGMVAPSQQGFYIANSGIEYGIRYASERGWTTGSDLDGMVVNLGQGQFTLDYDEPADTLSSTGQVSGAQREVALENFTSFVSDIQCLELVTSIDPSISGIPPCTYDQRAGPSDKTFVRFYIRNICSSQPTITLTDFQATWNPAAGVLERINFKNALKFRGGYASGDPWSAFNRGGRSQDVDTCDGGQYEGVQVKVRFSEVLTGNTTFVFQFRDTNGDGYTFDLGDPPNCS